jgi:hypothetical protein
MLFHYSGDIENIGRWDEPYFEVIYTFYKNYTRSGQNFMVCLKPYYLPVYSFESMGG